MLHLALYQPDIPQNTGALIRLAACLGAAIEIIEPCGFIFDDAKVRRAHMDYIDLVKITRHINLDAFRTSYPNARFLLLAPQGETSIYDFSFHDNDILILGPESRTTLPELIHFSDDVLKIPMQPDARSLNVAMAGAIALGEARRQWPI